MTSQIQPDAIDVEFPVAGQDNDSQGFRDNFSVIQNSLATAASEITDLQTNAARLDVDNDFNGNIIGNVQTNRLYGTVFTKSNPPVGTVTVDYEEGELCVISLTSAGNRSIRIENWPTGKLNTEVYGKVRVLVKNNIEVDPVNFVTNTDYVITVLGDTDWTAIGAGATYDVGTRFTATGAGTGTGKAVEVTTVTFISGTNPIFDLETNLVVEVWTPDNGATVYITKLGETFS